MPKSIKTPLSIYVLFHPDSHECRALAGHLHRWFRLKEDDGEGTEAGLPIWLRTRLDGGAITPTIDWEAADLNVLVVLADDHMVVDEAWRNALRTLLAEADALNGPRVLVLPAGVDWSAFRMDFLFYKRGGLPVGSPRAADATEDPTDKTFKARVAVRARELRRVVTEAVTRELRKADGETRPEPLKVFLSHAKQDGRAIAEHLRDGLADISQLETWYDEHDLAPGHEWRLEMDNAARSGSAALIAVETDVYPTRPWCRHEITVARQPRPVGEGGRVWTVQPVVSISHRTRLWSRPLAQLGQVPSIGWPSAEEEQPLRITHVVDRLLLETLLIQFYIQFAEKLAEQHIDDNLVLLTWVPDPWSLANLWGELARKDGTIYVAYPGHGLRTAERRMLTEFMGKVAGREDAVRLISHERLAMRDEEPLEQLVPRRDERRSTHRVAMSSSGTPESLEPAGVGVEHVNDAMVRITRRLLEEGWQIHMGGSLMEDASLTRELVEVAQGWDLEQAETTGPQSEVPPAFVNYARWPSSTQLTKRKRASLHGVCRFEMIGPASEFGVFDETEKRHRQERATVNTRMREQSANVTEFRIVIGGKIVGWRGRLPGVAEEVMTTLKAGGVPLVVGGFGGCAGKIAEFLKSPDAPPPPELTSAYAWGHPDNGNLRDTFTEKQARRSFSELRSVLTRHRAWLYADDDLMRIELRSLLETSSTLKATKRILSLIAQGPLCGAALEPMEVP